MTHVTQQQRAQIADLKAAGLSFVRISQQTGINQSTCKNVFYRDNPASASSFKSKDGKFRTTAPRSGPGRKPRDGLEAASDKQRAAEYRARRKAHLDSLVSNLESATDADLVALLETTFKAGNEAQVKDVVAVLHGRYCGKT
jgi:hypothetical protein